jgi:hypothetical protein
LAHDPNAPCRIWEYAESGGAPASRRIAEVKASAMQRVMNASFSRKSDV